jgi:hypothetical protein
MPWNVKEQLVEYRGRMSEDGRQKTENRKKIRRSEDQKTRSREARRLESKEVDKLMSS